MAKKSRKSLANMFNEAVDSSISKEFSNEFPYIPFKDLKESNGFYIAGFDFEAQFRGSKAIAFSFTSADGLMTREGEVIQPDQMCWTWVSEESGAMYTALQKLHEIFDATDDEHTNTLWVIEEKYSKETKRKYNVLRPVTNE